MGSHDERINAYYSEGNEATRLTEQSVGGVLELRAARRSFSLIKPASCVLDIGGATGVHAAWLAEQGHEVTLVDPAASQVEIAKAHSTFTALVGDARELPFDKETFDVAIMFGPLYHLADSRDRLIALSEAKRVLRPGGLIFVAALSRLSAFSNSVLESGGQSITAGDVEVLRTGDWVNDGPGFPGGHFHTAAELRHELENSGFSNISIRSLDFPSLVFESIKPRQELIDSADFLLQNLEETFAGLPIAETLANLSPHILGIGQK